VRRARNLCGIGRFGARLSGNLVLVSDKEHWKPEPDDHDYPAAESYLSLLLPPVAVEGVVKELREAPIAHWKAKDLLRASGLPLLPADNPHVSGDLQKVSKGVKLSPVLLVRGDMTIPAPMQIADGYHRVCASYHLHEDTDIPCRIASRPR
jgi:hypothetical protein